MTTRPTVPRYRIAGPALVRIPLAPLERCDADRSMVAVEEPSPGELLARVEELRTSALFREAIGLASPSVAIACAQPLDRLPVKRLRALAGSLAAYDARMRSRATPFGLFAGVTLARPADRTEGSIPGEDGYRRVVRPDAGWLWAVIEGLERTEPALRELTFVVHPAMEATSDGYQLRAPDARTRRVRLGASPAVRALLERAAAPVRGDNLLDVLRARGHSPHRAVAVVQD